MSREDLRSDISQLLSLPKPTLSALLNLSTRLPPPSSSSTRTPIPPTSSAIPTHISNNWGPQQPAIDLLETFTPSGANHETSQALIKAYIRDMRGIIPMGAEGEGERLGGRIDVVRERAEGVGRVLEGVRP